VLVDVEALGGSCVQRVTQPGSQETLVRIDPLSRILLVVKPRYKTAFLRLVERRMYHVRVSALGGTLDGLAVRLVKSDGTSECPNSKRVFAQVPIGCESDEEFRFEEVLA